MDFQTLSSMTSGKVIPFSVKEKEGMEDLIQEIHRLFYHGEIHGQNDFLVCNARHKAGLAAASEALSHVLETVQMGMPEDLFCVDLMDAYEELGKITGEEVGEDLVNEIFSSFCMGK